jgi:predicted nucleic acid-binding protein
MPQPVWQELSHKLMLAEAVMPGKVSGPNLAKGLSPQPDVVKGLGLCRDKVRSLVRLGLGFEPCTREDTPDTAFGFQEKYGLLTNHSVILAAASRVKADVLATANRAFENFTELTIAMPSDVRR